MKTRLLILALWLYSLGLVAAVAMMDAARCPDRGSAFVILSALPRVLYIFSGAFLGAWVVLCVGVLLFKPGRAGAENVEALAESPATTTAAPPSH